MRPPLMTLGSARSAPLSLMLFPVAAVSVCALGAVTLLANLSVAAVSVDEPGYLAAGADYVAGAATLNLEHPYLAKQLIGISQAVLGESLLAGRLPGVGAAALTGMVVFAVGREVAGRWAGLVAAGLWLGLPQAPGTIVLRLDRYAVLEPPMVLFSMLAVLLALLALRTGRRPRRGARRCTLLLGAGAAVGLATSAKFTGVLAMAAVATVVAVSGGALRRRGALIVGVLLAAAIAFWLPYAAQRDPGLDGLRYAAAFQTRHVATGHPQIVAGRVYTAAPWWSNGWWQWSYLGWTGVLALWTLAATGLLAPPRLGHERALRLSIGTFLVAGLAFISLYPVRLPHYHLVLVAPLCIAAGAGMVAMFRSRTPMRLVGMVLAAPLLMSVVTTAYDAVTLEPANYGRLEQSLRAAGVPAGEVAVWGWVHVAALHLDPGTYPAVPPLAGSRPVAVVVDPVVADRQRGTPLAATVTGLTRGCRGRQVDRLTVYLCLARG